jgi:DNA-directed RNA polymerase subunit RPC12/RpoP
MAKRKTETEPTEQTKRTYTQAPVAVDPGVPCSHCGHRYGHRVTNTYPNGNRRRVCGACGKPFVAVRVRE